MKSLIPSVVVGLLTLLGVWLIQHPPTTTTFAAAPSASWLLYVVVAVAALPFLGEFAHAWWKRAKGTVSAGRGLVSVVGQRVGGGSTWKTLAVGMVVGAVIAMAGAGLLKLPTFDWGKILPPSVVTPAKGERLLVIVRESEDDDTQFSGLIGEIRAADYLKSKGHSLVVFDDDDQDKDGKPVPFLDKLKPFLKRELIILDKATNKVLSRGDCPADTAAVVAAVQKAGG